MTLRSWYTSHPGNSIGEEPGRSGEQAPPELALEGEGLDEGDEEEAVDVGGGTGVARKLRQAGVSALAYSAKLGVADRDDHQDRWGACTARPGCDLLLQSSPPLLFPSPHIPLFPTPYAPPFPSPPVPSPTTAPVPLFSYPHVPLFSFPHAPLFPLHLFPATPLPTSPSAPLTPSPSSPAPLSPSPLHPSPHTA
ncbi:unnamed protein product [Closterium sp. Naga37s-1]|nr:unnamed protein product [Closterium sp. Naga37s-1]